MVKVKVMVIVVMVVIDDDDGAGAGGGDHEGDNGDYENSDVRKISIGVSKEVYPLMKSR